MIRIFAIGTLKKGYPLHGYLEGAEFLGQGTSCRPFPLVIAGPWFAPMLINEPGVGRHIKGELYRVSPDELAALDAAESVGRPGNYRQLIEVDRIDDHQSCYAFAYFKAAGLAEPVHSAHLDEYQDDRFIPPHLRPKA